MFERNLHMSQKRMKFSSLPLLEEQASCYNRLEECVLTFEPCQLSSNTKCLTQTIVHTIKQPNFSPTSNIRRLAFESENVFGELGSYCADLIWEDAFQAIPTEVSKLQHLFHGRQLSQPRLDSESIRHSVSPKVIRLLEILDCMTNCDEPNSCIIHDIGGRSVAL